jgi:antitoxin YefM
MNTITYSKARAKLADTMDRVCDDHEPVIITRSGQQAVVVMALDDYKSLEETSYLLRTGLGGLPALAEDGQEDGPADQWSDQRDQSNSALRYRQA